MTEYIIAILLLIASYLIGSIPFGLIVGKVSGKDIRKSGSGNIGSTNAIRVLGVKLGLLAAFFDVLKGTIIIIIIYILEATSVWRNPLVLNGESLYALYGLMAVVGHCFPVFLKFKGGKAVATSLGVLFAITPWCALIALLSFFLVVLICGYVSLGSTFAAISVVMGAFLIYGWGNNQYITCGIICILALLIVIKHIPNYKRLRQGTENSFKKKKTQNEA